MTTVKKDAIGQTFFDDNYEKSYLVGGERAEGIKITFLDDQKLSYTYGLFMCSVSEKGANWIEEEIYEEGEYEYEFSISSLEEVSLKFQGKSYEVGVHTEDNTISNIIFFPR